jgi:pseudaminic acid synthase
VSTFSIDTPRGKRTIGAGEPAFIIAEVSGNHNLSFDKAREIIDASVDAGVDAIKLQTYTADALTIDCDLDMFQVKVNDAWSGRTLHELYREAYTPWEWQPKLKEHAESRGVVLFSTPFDDTAVDFLESMQVVLYKVASFEIGHIPLLRKIGATGKPVIISRGLATIDEIERAIDTLRGAGSPEVAVLHCVSSYPAEFNQMNLRTIPDIAQRFRVVAGLSDHSLGIVAPIAAVSLGASIIEKHVTIARSEGGPDAAFSLEPRELRELVLSVRAAEAALGEATYTITEREAENRVFKRSIFVVEGIKKGEPFTERNIRIIRPGYGMSPAEYDTVLDRVASCDLPRGTPLTPDCIANR